MSQDERIIQDIRGVAVRIATIYRSHGIEAFYHLRRMHDIRQQKGEGFIIIRSWFVSTPQKWRQVEPLVFKLDKELGNLELETILSAPLDTIAGILRPIGFQRQLAMGLQKFTRVVKGKYGTWAGFVQRLQEDNIFEIYRELNGQGARITFKNLAAIFINLSISERLLILDKHVGNILGLSNSSIIKIRTDATLFRQLLFETDELTEVIRSEIPDVTTTRWSLATWFYQSNTRTADLERVISYVS